MHIWCIKIGIVLVLNLKSEMINTKEQSSILQICKKYKAENWADKGPWIYQRWGQVP
jgi:hypothetical protein